MRVSVVISVRNGERYLRDCIDSVLGQTLRDYELICVDDGSTDGTAAILDGYAAADARVRVLHEPPADAGAGRNRGMSVATGETLVFLDADDVFSPRLLEVLDGGLRECGADVSVCRHVSFKDGDSPPPMAGDVPAQWTSREAGDPRADVFRDISSCAWDKAFRREFVMRHGFRFLQQPSTNDLTFVLSAVSAAGRCAFTTLALVAHRYHAASVQATRGKAPGLFFGAVRAYCREMSRVGCRSERPWVWDRFRAYYLEHLFWQFGTMRTREAYAEFRRQAIAAEADLRIGEGNRPSGLLGRRRMRRYGLMIAGSRIERIWAWLECLLTPYTGDYELATGFPRLVKRAARWSVSMLFDPLLPLAKIKEDCR